MAIFDRTFDEVSNTSFSRRTARTQNVYRRRSLLQRIRPEGPIPSQGSRRPRFSFFLCSCQRTRSRTDFVRSTHPRAHRALWHIPSVRPNEATFNTFSNRLATPSEEKIAGSQSEGFRRQRHRRRRWSGLYAPNPNRSTPHVADSSKNPAAQNRDLAKPEAPCGVSLWKNFC